MALDGWRSNLSPDAANYISRLESRLKAVESKIGAVGSRVSYLSTKNRKIPKKGAAIRGQIPENVEVGSGDVSIADDGTVSFTGCSSVSLNGVFDGTGADIYEIYISFSNSTASHLQMRLRSAGTDYTGNHSYIGFFGNLSAGPARSASSTSSNFFLTPSSSPQVVDANCSIRIYNPSRSSHYTTADTMTSAMVSGDRWMWNQALQASTTSAFDGFTLFCPSGNTTGFLKVVKVA